VAETLEPRLLLAFAPVFGVNATTTGNQSFPAIAIDDVGNYVVAWSGNGPGDANGVVAQRYHAGGAPVGIEFLVNNGSANNQWLPSIAMDSAGNFVIAWQTGAGPGSNDGSGYGIYARRYSNEGAPGPQFLVNTFTDGNQASPSVAMDADGDFVVAWNSAAQDGSSYGIYAQRYSAAGAAVGDEFRVNTFTAEGQDAPKVAMDADGNFIITWRSYLQDGSGLGVYAQRYDAEGAAVGEEFRVNSTTEGHQEDPSVAMDADGDFVVTWMSSRPGSSDVFAQRYTADGAAAGGEMHVSNPVRPAGAATVDMNAAGDFVIAWRSGLEGSSGYGIYARRYTSAGDPILDQLGVSAPPNNFPANPAIAVEANGDFVTAWDNSSQFGGATDILARKYDRTPPVLNRVTASSVPVLPGQLFRYPVRQVVVTFSERLSSLGANSGANSVINPANWRLTRNGVDFSSRITGLSFSFNTSSRTYNAAVSFLPTLSFDGDYILTARETLQDFSGNALDGNFDGIPGGDYNLPFTVHPIVNIDPEFRVNSHTTLGQTAPAVASDADGNFVVAWQSDGQDGSGNGIYAQRYNSAGTALGEEFRVNTFTDDQQISPAIAMNATGDFVIVWQSLGQDESGFGIYAQRYSAAGAAVGEEFRVNSTTTHSQQAASVAIDGAGNFVVAWESDLQAGTGYDVYAKRYNAAGAAVGAEFPVNSYTTNDQRIPSVATNDAGNLVIFWQSTLQDNSANGIYGQRYNGSGAPVGAEFIGNSQTASSQDKPSVAMDAAGNFVLAYKGQQDDTALGIFFRRFTASGIGLDPDPRVNTITNRSQDAPSIAVDTDGNFVVVWQSALQDGSGNGVYARRYNAAGVAVSLAEFLVNTTTAASQEAPSVAMDSDGNFVVAWQSDAQDGSGFGIYAQSYNANQTPTTLGLPSVDVNDYSPNTLIALFPRFADSTDAAAAMTYSVASNTNPSLFTSTAINSTTGILTLDYATGHGGTANITIRATDTGGLFVDTILVVNVTQLLPPTVTASAFLYQSAPQRLSFTFSQDVRASLSASSVTVQRLSPNPASISVSSPVWDALTNTATFNFTGILPDGNYRATLNGATIKSGGPFMTTNPVLPFFFLNGDLNLDRSVTIADFLALASKLGQSNATWTDGDLNYDSQVSIADFLALSANFNKTLPSPLIATAALSSASLTQSGGDVLDRKEKKLPAKKPRIAHHRRAAKPRLQWRSIGRNV
jgi:hypothetical protein